MNQYVRTIEDRAVWDGFFKHAQAHTFLHSWNWAEFSKQRGDAIWRLGIFEEHTLLGIALVILIRARRGSFLFCPHGPLLRGHYSVPIAPAFRVLIEYLSEIALEENARFIRVSSLFADTSEHNEMFRSLGFRRAPMHMHPERAWILDISKSEDEILRGMRKQTRHCIRNAQNAGVSVRMSDTMDDLYQFHALYKETAIRQRFVPFSLEYLKAEFCSFARDNNAKIFLASLHSAIISGAIIIFQEDSAFYHQGASRDLYPKTFASHLLQWRVIKEAKKRGCRFYNFWGIAPEGARNHPWSGLSLFKKGFGGTSEEYVPAQDFIIKNSYWITYAIERIRRARRRL